MARAASNDICRSVSTACARAKSESTRPESGDNRHTPTAHSAAHLRDSGIWSSRLALTDLLFFGYRRLLERGRGELLRIQWLEQVARGRKAALGLHIVFG